MIVKIHSRGAGGGSSPVNYLLGKDRDREGATLDRGDPEQIIELIDSNDYARKYTSGVLSFAERDLSREQKDQIMSDFEKAILPGLEKDQYSILWVEHQDKDRLELNFVIPNVELQSGKRLQPYYDRADRPRINAWKNIVNAEYKLHDPNDPLNKRELCTPNNLPKGKQYAAKAITDGLLRMADSGSVSSRQDILKTLEGAGFEVARTTPKSISIKDPEGGKNIRLKGMIYEQDFRYGEELRAEIEGASQRYRESAGERLQESRETYQRAFDGKRESNQKRYNRPERAYTPSSRENMDLPIRGDNHAHNRVLGHSDVPVVPNQRQLADHQQSVDTDPKSKGARGQHQNDPMHRRQEPQPPVHTDQSARRDVRQQLHDSDGLLDQIKKNLAQADENLAKTLPIDDVFGHRAIGNLFNRNFQREVLSDDRAREATTEQLRTDSERQREETSRVLESLQSLGNILQPDQERKRRSHQTSERATELTANTERDSQHANQQLDRASEQLSQSSQQIKEIDRENRRSRDVGSRFER
jgi:hypothetical protein